MKDEDRRPPDPLPVEGLAAGEAARRLEQAQRAKFHSPGGHGFAAEDANAFADRLRGRRVEVTGRSNELNGADRVVDGVPVQTKYYASAQQTVDAAFEGAAGAYRYAGQQLEVPADQYDQAVAVMEERIRQGRVPGTSDPREAKQIVRKGSVTYKQARNIARAGTVDSLVYDAKTAAVSSTYVLAISFLVDYARQKWSGEPTDVAVRQALRTGLVAGSTSFVASVVAAQVLRTRGAAIGAVVARNSLGNVARNAAGQKAIQNIARASLGRSVYGAAATSHVAKLLRTNLITGAVATAVTSAPDFYRVALSRTISWTQFRKNLFVNAGGIGAGMIGFMVGGALGVPFGGPVGVFVFGLAGALIAGSMGTKAAKSFADRFAEDDADRVLRIIRPAAERLVCDYVLSEPEIEQFAAGFRKLATAGWLREMFRTLQVDGEPACERRAVAELEPICERIAAGRASVSLPELSRIEAEFDRLAASLEPVPPPRAAP